LSNAIKLTKYLSC